MAGPGGSCLVGNPTSALSLEKRDLENHCTSVCSLNSGLSVSDTNTQKPLCLVGEYSPVDRSWNKNRNDRFAVVTAASGDSELISFLKL